MGSQIIRSSEKPVAGIAYLPGLLLDRYIAQCRHCDYDDGYVDGDDKDDDTIF